jgi:hypothetical protein
MEEHTRMWKPESKRPEKLLPDKKMWQAHYINKGTKTKAIQYICKIGTTIWVPNLAGYM